MKQIFVFLLTCFVACGAFADDDSFRTLEEILNREPDNTPCATAVFESALATNANLVSETDSEEVIQRWIKTVFAKQDVLRDALDCPEFKSIEQDDTLKLEPIKYTFPGGREIVVEYETQPQILDQRILLATKRDLSKLSDPSPKIGAIDDRALWTNTDPAWYAIMVTQHGALDEFVGPDKNNTISLQYIYDHVNDMYPNGATCTSKSALGGNARTQDAINIATRDIVDIENDTNYYYVMGDVNLRWISYAEIAAEVAIGVATMGGGEIIAGITKSARATQRLNKLREIIRTLRESPKVGEYMMKSQKLHKSERTLERINRFKKLEKEMATLDKVKDADKIAEFEKLSKELREIDKITNLSPQQAKRLTDLEKRESKIMAAQKKNIGKREAEELRRELTSVRQERNTIRNAAGAPNQTQLNTKISELETEIKNITTEMEKMAKTEKDVQEYMKATKSYSEIQKYRRAYKNFDRLRKTKQTGNIVARAKGTWNTIKAGAQAAKANFAGAKAMDKGAKIARRSMKSGRVVDWLFDSTLKNATKLGHLTATSGALYTAITFAKDMYDWTETSTGNYTNGVDFKPLLLLGADDLEGQENEVNYGMWLLWQGGATDPADDDAAFLQAFDFADKLHYSLVETMENTNSNACNVDIYIVRPVLRNPDGENPELYYLIMNDTPWTTAD